MKPVGLLLVDKPEGPTSHDMVEIARRLIGVRRVGHAGTLDPLASGLMLLCVGWATRLAEYLAVLPKTYRAVIRLGERTDTDDRTGTVTARSEAWRAVDAGQVRRALQRQLGEFEQLPPAHSAKKVAGQRAYVLARAGEAPRLQPQRVTIWRLSLSEMSLPSLTVEAECSSGTYIRSVARDLGEALGVGAHLTGLRRLRVGSFDVADAIALGQYTLRDRVIAQLRPPEAAVAHLRRVDLGAEAREALRHGRPVESGGVDAEGPVAVFVDGELVALAQAREGQLRPKKVFVAELGPRQDE